MIVSHVESATKPNLLILGGATEATRLAALAAQAGLSATVSLAGRVARPAPLPLPVRIGGFGGAAGLAGFLRERRVTHLIDATHPFAARISANAARAAAQTGTPLIALTRPPWRAGAGDDWRRVPDIAAAARALNGPPRRVMLAIGRQHLQEFAAQPQHFYLLRLVDPPQSPPPLPRRHVIVARGPFHTAGDRALMARCRIEVVVSKNAGGDGAYAKIAAARALKLPVLMIERPAPPARRETGDPQEVLDWIAHGATARGV